MKVRVKATVFVEVELSDDTTEDQRKFYIEENGCPGTGAVGAAINAAMDDGEEKHVCWACNLGGTNEIVPPVPAT